MQSTHLTSEQLVQRTFPGIAMTALPPGNDRDRLIAVAKRRAHALRREAIDQALAAIGGSFTRAARSVRSGISFALRTSVIDPRG